MFMLNPFLFLTFTLSSVQISLCGLTHKIDGRLLQQKISATVEAVRQGAIEFVLIETPIGES